MQNNRGVPTKQIYTDCLLSAISLAGIIGNYVALRIITRSRRIRASRPYILLVNQSLLDLVGSILTIVCTATKYAVEWRWPSEFWARWMLCEVLLSQMPFAATTCASSYNLCALSAERMAGVVWPVQHRAHFNARNLRRLAVAVWLLGAALILAHSVPSNRPDETGNGCYFWSGLEDAGSNSTWRMKTLAIGFNASFSFVPFTIMVASYAAIYWRISNLGKDGKLPASVKMNVVRMLATCVFLFFVCHSLRIVLSLADRFFSRHWMRTPIFIVAVSLVQMNSLVNPLVYSAQYEDYKRELARQTRELLRSCGSRGNGASGESEDSERSATSAYDVSVSTSYNSSCQKKGGKP